METPPLESWHPLAWAALAALMLLNLYLFVLLWRRWQHFHAARRWPRLTVRADRVDLMRVVHARDGLPTGTTEHHEAVLHFCYRVDGRDYHQQRVTTVADRASADSLKTDATLSFLYNPRRPQQTLETPDGPLPLLLTALGLLVVNGMGLGMVTQLAAFLAA